MTKKQNRLCYLCGSEGADTKDHVPPRGIFPLKPKGQLITVPAHRECNAKFQSDDELFRNLIIAASYRTPEGRTAWQEQVVKSWNSNPKAKNILKDLLFRVNIKDPQNNLTVPVEALRIDVNLVERQVARWSRGLFYKRFRSPLSQSSEIVVNKLGPPEVSIIPLMKEYAKSHMIPRWHEVETNVFSYAFVTSTEAKDIGFAIFIFFNTEVYSAAINVYDKSKSVFLNKTT